MPIARFICPDNVEVPIEQCFTACRMKSRCMPLAILRVARREREHTPIPSASMVSKGARQIILEARQPYAINPRGVVWSLIGVSTHSLLEKINDDGLQEQSFQYPKEDPFVTGTLDYFSPSEKTLWDFKVWGSFKIQKLLDKDEEAVFDVAMQTNCYRLFLVDAGYEVNRIALACIPRDGGTYIAKQRGVTEEIYLIDLPMMDLELVKSFYREKAKILRNAYETGMIPPYCSERETWHRRKCDKYCPVAVYCAPPWLDLKEKERRQWNGQDRSQGFRNTKGKEAATASSPSAGKSSSASRSSRPANRETCSK